MSSEAERINERSVGSLQKIYAVVVALAIAQAINHYPDSLIFVGKGLFTGRKVNNGETTVIETDSLAKEKALVIRSPMSHSPSCVARPD